MNISKFTQKSVQAVQDLEKVAYEYGNQEIEEEHLLYALLTQEDSLILKLIEKMEIQKEYLSLDLTARNDWSSTLPKQNNSFFYPSANLSFVISDLFSAF